MEGTAHSPSIPTTSPSSFTYLISNLRSTNYPGCFDKSHLSSISSVSHALAIVIIIIYYLSTRLENDRCSPALPAFHNHLHPKSTVLHMSTAGIKHKQWPIKIYLSSASSPNRAVDWVHYSTYAEGETPLSCQYVFY